MNINEKEIQKALDEMTPNEFINALDDIIANVCPELYEFNKAK